jgi:hypothetical protein
LRVVARLTSMILLLGLAVAGSAGASSTGGAYSFVSAPRLHPPKLEVLERHAGLTPGDFLVTNVGIEPASGTQAVGESGPMVLDGDARPIWFRNVPRDRGIVLDFDQETYLGQPVLMWVQGRTLVVVNRHYRRIATLQARAPWFIDGHEAEIVGGDVWVTVARYVPDQDLTAHGGPRRGTVLDCAAQEYQLSTGRLLRTWDVLNPGGNPRVPLSASKQPVTGSLWDPYHLNTIQPLPGGDLLASMRNTWSVYLISPASGRIMWTLGGKQSSFTLGPGAQFAWQHDARLTSPGQGGVGAHVQLTLFNDDCCAAWSGGQPSQLEGPSEGMVLDLDTLTGTATLGGAYLLGAPGTSRFLGSMELLPGGNALVGWGSLPYFSEYSPAGQKLLSVKLPGADKSYRALFTSTWVGTPYYPPSGAVRGRIVYASWNGATQVASWEVLAGGAVLASARRTGFETAIRLPRSYRAYMVRALNARGKALGTSRSFS